MLLVIFKFLRHLALHKLKISGFIANNRGRILLGAISLGKIIFTPPLCPLNYAQSLGSSLNKKTTDWCSSNYPN